VLSLRSQTFPALFGLYNNGFLPKGIRVVGYARTKMDEEVRLIPLITATELSGHSTESQKLQRHRWGRASSRAESAGAISL
jgi:glucose-6-phosphate 1-dehydrogenase